jgi:protein-tyrosine phosphatase
VGADIRISPDMGQRIRDGHWPAIAKSRYFLFEPDHHVATPGMTKLAKKLLKQGLVPVLTHPERLRWLDGHYDLVHEMWEMGCVIQITAGAITGRFGKQPQKWAERMLEDGIVDVIATDAHNMHRRPPLLHEGYEAAAAIVGEESAWAMVHDTPLTILRDEPLARRKRGSISTAQTKEKRQNKKESFSLLDSLKRMWSL